MQKLLRSLIAIGGLAGLAACGDDVSVTEPPPPALTISGAPVTAISIGSKVQLSASEAATWATSDATVASVDGTGLVTAVKGGVASITATATADVSRKASVTITVTALANATVSVSNITQAGVPGNPTVNVNNVAGSIDVNLNVEPGDQIVSRVEVLIDGAVACTQNLSGAQNAALSLAAASPELEAVIVSCQVNTAAFNPTSGVASFANGSRVLSARAILAGGTQVATPSTPLVFNNNSGVIALATNNNGTDPATAINPGTGLQWMGGSATVTFTGVSYVSGTTVASVTCQIFGKDARPVPLTAGTGFLAYSESSNWSSTDLDVGNYTSAAAESVVCSSATLSNGAPMASTGGSVLLNYGSPANPTVGGNAAMPALQVFRLDNTAPGIDSQNGVLQTAIDFSAGLGVVDTVGAPWVNAATSLVPAATGSSTNVLGLPSLAELNNPANAVELGVDAITVSVFVPAAGGTLPTTGGSCNVTGLTSVTTGSQLTATLVASAYPARIVFKDALGNQFCYSLGAFGGPAAIGADFTAPTGSITGPAANTGFTAAPNWAVAASDDASGFTSEPLIVSMTRLPVSGSTACVIGTANSCADTPTQPLTFGATGGSGTQGYYTTSITLSDAAGNTVSLVSAQVNAFDATAPTFTGGISLPSLIAGATTNTFSATVSDNLDLNSIFGVVAYGTANLQYPSQSVGAFGPPLDQGPTTVNYAVANWIRCLNPVGNFATTTNQAQTIALTVSDHAANTDLETSLGFGTNAQVCNAVGNTGATINRYGTYAAADSNLFAVFPTGITQVDIDGAGLVAASAATVTLRVMADVSPINTAPNPFQRVDFYYQNALGNWVLIGSGSAAQSVTTTNKTFVYTLPNWDPDANVAVGLVNIVAIGIDAQGDAVMSNTIAITTVQ